LDDNIPPRPVECVDLKEHSPTRAVYLLDDAEAEQLSQHSDIKFIHLDQSKYPDLFPPKPDELHTGNRYTTPVKNYRDLTVGYPNPTTTADINRAGYQILRGTSYANSWTTAASVVNSVVPNVTGTGIDIDVIVGDEGCWFGHVEFANNTGNGPVDYKWANAGNPLSSTGTCDVLDLVLDGPYYIDPAWFNASPSTRLMTRWDGTRVPTETAARDWWGNASLRSSAFAGAGTVSIPSYYTRANCNGSDTALSSEGQHGTACAGQTYGRTFGWAYNANKWFIDAYGSYGLWPVDNYFDVMKIFHQTKPVNPTYGNKNPTISSNSWGFRANQGTSGYYYFRQGTTGTGGVSYSSKPAFMQYLGSTGDGGRFKGEMLDNSLTVAGDELIAAGVIFVAAAGNSNQQQVSPDHPNFNNYWASSSGTPLASATHDEFGSTCYNTTSRRGFPQHLGKFTTGTTIVYPAINIGALDDSYIGPGSLERKVDYSDMGNEIDIFAPGDGTLTSSWQAYGIQYPRQDQRGGGALTSYDTRFSGTSSACPTAAGMIATALQYNRTWTWQDVRTWLHSLTAQSTSTFYVGTEPTTATDGNWSDLNGLMGAVPRVLYNNIVAPTTSTTTLTVTTVVSNISLQVNQAVTPVTPVTASGGTSPLSFAVAPTLPTGLSFASSTGQITGTPTALSTASSYKVTVTDAVAVKNTGTFTLSVSAVALVTTLAISSQALTVLQSASFIPVTASGGFGSISFSISPTLPAGLSFNTTTGSISGTPTALKTTTSYTVTAQDQAGQTSSKSFSLTVGATALVAVINTSSVSGKLLETLTPVTPVTATGGSGTKTYAITPTLPSGLTFSTSTGQISGTPSTARSSLSHTVTVSDQYGQSVTGNFTLAVVATPISVVTNVTARVILIGEPLIPFAPITATGGSPTGTAITYSVTPLLPQGITLNTTTGVISGTPTFVAGSISYTVTARDSAGQTVSASFVLRIRSNLPLIFSEEQNLIYNEVFTLMGSTSTGYGSPLASEAVSPGQLVSGEDFNLLKDDIRRMIIHQFGTGSNHLSKLKDAIPGTLVDHSVPQRLWTQVQFLKRDPTMISLENLRSMTINTKKDSLPEWTSTWNYAASNGYIAPSSFAWSTATDVNYFFNTGATIRPEIEIIETPENAAEEALWAPLVAQANAVLFDKDKFLQLKQDGEWVEEFTDADVNQPARSIIVTFAYHTTTVDNVTTVHRNVINTSLHFIAGYYGKKGKKDKLGKKKDNTVTVKINLRTTFKTYWASAELGGIASPVPQTQLMGGYLSAPPVPIPTFGFAVNSSKTREVILRNNTNSTATITNITLTPPPGYTQEEYPELYPGYSTGTVSKTNFEIESGNTGSFFVSYSGNVPGVYKGKIFVQASSNDIVLFTDISIGEIDPGFWTQTVTTNNIISKDFTINLAPNVFRGFSVSMPEPTGFKLYPKINDNTFRVEYNPEHSTEGLHDTVATVRIFRYDTTESTLIDVPINITTNVLYANLQSWVSAAGPDDRVLGMSYDIFGGRRYFTVGIGVASDASELGNELLEFPSWQEVYRMELTTESKKHFMNDDTIVKRTEFSGGNTVSSYFGVGNAKGSLLTINDYGTGDLRIDMNNVRTFVTIDEEEAKTLRALANAFFYYDETVERTTQLETPNQFQDGFTRFVTGINRNGGLVTSLVNPNVLP
jgi:hypothetical protein